MTASHGHKTLRASRSSGIRTRSDGYAVEPKPCYVVGTGDRYLGLGYYTSRANASVIASAPKPKEGLATFVETAAPHARLRGLEGVLRDFNPRAGPFVSGVV